jgi:hypothetical protein
MLKQGEDFYINDAGLFVFTRDYHLKRGECCGSGCLHCPYEHKNVAQKQRVGIPKP